MTLVFYARMYCDVLVKLYNMFYVTGPLTKAALLLVIPANLPGDTGLSPWNRRAPKGSQLAKELYRKTCKVHFCDKIPYIVHCF